MILRRMLLFIVLMVTLILTGCGGPGHDLVKNVEGKLYDRVAGTFSKLCEGKTKEGTIGLIARQEALELRREIRQRGTTGPQGPLEKPEFLDDKTAYGLGPIVRVWCDGDPVPENIWWDFVRIRP